MVPHKPQHAKQQVKCLKANFEASTSSLSLNFPFLIYKCQKDVKDSKMLLSSSLKPPQSKVPPWLLLYRLSVAKWDLSNQGYQDQFTDKI